MSKAGRPRNTNGSLYQRRASSVWWMSYRDAEGRFRQESTAQRDRAEAEKVLRKRLVARDEGLLCSAVQGGRITFDEWADWFLEHRSKPPFRSEKTHEQNLNALKHLRPVFGEMTLSEIKTEHIEQYLRKRLDARRKVHTKFGVKLLGSLKPTTVHQEFRVVRRILNVAVKKQRLAANPCGGVEFPVAVATGVRKPHYMTASEQTKIEAVAPTYLANIAVIMVEMGLRPYRELLPMRKQQVDLENGIVHLPDSKTANGIADMPMTGRAKEAFRSQMKESGDSEYLFPSTKAGATKPHLVAVRKIWDRTLERAGVAHFALYELRHTFATRLSAGGVADHFVTQMLRQGDASVFKRYSQAKLGMMREALAKLDRNANERDGTSLTVAVQ